MDILGLKKKLSQQGILPFCTYDFIVIINGYD